MIKEKQITLVKFILLWCTVTVGIFSIFVMVLVGYIGDDLNKKEIRSQLNAALREAGREIEVENEEAEDGTIVYKPVLPSKIEDIEPYFKFVLIDSSGEIVLGEYPDDCEVKKDIRIFNRYALSDDGKYYVADRENVILKRKNWLEMSIDRDKKNNIAESESVNGTKQKVNNTEESKKDRYSAKKELEDQMDALLVQSGDYTLRCIVGKNDIQSEYKVIRLYLLFGFGVEILIFLLFGLLMKKQISKPLDDMRTQTIQISKDLDLSERIEYSGMFQELSILFDAYNHLLSRMEHVMSCQEQFNSDVSHELRTPITVIRAQVQLALEQIGSDENSESFEWGECMERIDRQTKNMNQIVVQLLELSRFAQNRIEPDMEEIDLVDIVESICEDEECSFGGALVFENDLSSVVVQIDIALISMAIHNLISNAIKYSPEGSPIKVTCGSRISEKSESEAFVSVLDHGCGIDQEALPYIFDYYYREEKARSTKGFGLGLTLAMKIAKLHGGTISVSSIVGSGSEFILTIPIK